MRKLLFGLGRRRVSLSDISNVWLRAGMMRLMMMLDDEADDGAADDNDDEEDDDDTAQPDE